MSQKTVDDASSWWYYFIRTDETHVKCNSCEWERVYDSKKGTNSLKCHLEKKHQDKFKEKEEAEKKKRDAENKRKTAREQQPNLFKHGFSSSCQTEQQSSRKRQHSPIRNFPIFKKFESGSENEALLEQKISEMIALDYQPFSVVEDEGFTRLLNFLAPGYKQKTRKHFSDSLIPSIYQKLFAKVKSNLTKSDHFSFTIDGWTSRNEAQSLVSLTVHYIDELFEPKFYILEARPVHGRHTAENYVEILNDSLELFGIEQHKIHLFMRDAQSTMQATTRGLNVDSFDCLAHKIQLSVNDGLRTIDGFRTIRESAKKITRKIRKSQICKDRLKELQKFNEIPQRMLIKDVEVRWNSTYLMLKSLLENRRVLSILSQDENLPKFTEIEWEMISAIVEVLEPMYLATLEIENRRCSISSCVPIVTTIIRHLECNANRPQIQLNEFRKAISDGLKFRMAKAGWEQWCCTNSALPGHRSLLKHTAAEFATLSPNGNQSSDHLESPIRLGGIFALMEAQESDQNAFIQPISDANQPDSLNLDPETQAIVQVAEYLAEKPIPFSSDPFVYWNSCSDMCSRLGWFHLWVVLDGLFDLRSSRLC
ncbi:hypothetical protein niasHT_000747 [Heterodera trifolii]|uniref:BED-type domain-containing protein n=1 Tax=Heterodera trifolii TaxID=157864 RepID=A0ABD2LNH2_9BILA